MSNYKTNVRVHVHVYIPNRYQFQPHKYDHDVALKILLKAVMALPETHLPLLLSVLPLNQVTIM